MLESMTGYGSAESLENGVKTLVELRSVNNRFAEISVKLPRQLLSYELEVREMIRAHFQRGKISAFIQIQLDRVVRVIVPAFQLPDRFAVYR